MIILKILFGLALATILFAALFFLLELAPGLLNWAQ